MPLIKSKSKKAFEHNIKAEAHAGKPIKQALAIAYEVKRRSKHAKGGEITAKTEKRPMPQQRFDDKKDIAQISVKHDMGSKFIDSKSAHEAQKGPKYIPLKHPKMVASDVFSTKLRDEEDHLMSSERPASPTEQPERFFDEQGADRQGPDDEALHMKKMAEGGVAREYGEGPEEDNLDEPYGLQEDDDQERLPVDEYMANHMKMLAEGGILHEMDEQPEDEEHEEHHASVAAAIMAKKARQRLSEEDAKEMHQLYASGGEVDLDLNAEEEPNTYYHQNEDAVLKENYDEDMDSVVEPEDSNEHGDSRESASENKHDMIDAIRRRIKSKRQF